MAERTPAGKRHTETIFVKDYYDFYPLHIYLDRPIGFAYNQEALDIFADFFRIPVHPEHRMEISVEKDEKGGVSSLEITSPPDDTAVQVCFLTFSALSGEHCYFTLNCETSNGESLNMDKVPGGYGIYRYPLYNTTDTPRRLQPEDLENCFPLDMKHQRVLALHAVEEGRRILLVTLEKEAYMLTVIDTEQIKTVQKIELLSTATINPQDTVHEFNRLQIHDDLLLATTGSGPFALLTRNEDGLYEKGFTADFSIHPKTQDFQYTLLEMAYDGKRLALGRHLYDYPEYNNIHLAVYTEEGLVYLGHYAYSLSRDFFDYHSNLLCRPWDKEALKLNWRK